MERLRPYDIPHKGLRNVLSQLLVLAGKTDYTNPEEVKTLHQKGHEAFTMLTVHADDENSITLAELEAKSPGASAHDMDDHVRLENLQQNLEMMLAEIQTGTEAGQGMRAEGDAFYLALSEFIAEYFAHTAVEEKVTQPILWEHFTDEDLIAMRGKIMAKMQPDVLMLWMKYSVPAQSHPERVAFLGGFKKVAPQPVFEKVMGVVAQQLTGIDLEMLNASLNN